MDSLVAILTELFRTYGYLAVFIGVMLENAGIPLPGETVLLFAGFQAAQGDFAISLVIVLAAFGAVLGDNFGYWLGSIGGRPFVERYGRYVFVTAARVDVAERYFQRYGPVTVYFARFIAGLRVFGALVAGISHMHYRTFFTYNLLGAVSWATVMGLLGYFLGHSWRALIATVKRIDLALAVFLGVVVAGILLRRWLEKRRAATLEKEK